MIYDNQVDGLVLDCCNSTAYALELQQHGQNERSSDHILSHSKPTALRPRVYTVTCLSSLENWPRSNRSQPHIHDN